MDGKIFSYPIAIKEMHLDMFGHVNNAAYLVLFEEARWDLITKNGYGLKKIQETKLGPVILEIKLTFLKELLLHDKVTVETQIISYEKKVGVIAQKMIRDNEVCCRAEIVMGLFNLVERKLVLPNAEWLQAVGGLHN